MFSHVSCYAETCLNLYSLACLRDDERESYVAGGSLRFELFQTRSSIVFPLGYLPTIQRAPQAWRAALYLKTSRHSMVFFAEDSQIEEVVRANTVDGTSIPPCSCFRGRNLPLSSNHAAQTFNPHAN